MKKMMMVLSLFFLFSELYAQKNKPNQELETLWQNRHKENNAIKVMNAYKNKMNQSYNYNNLLNYAKSVHFYGTFFLKDDQKKERIAAFTECISTLNKAIEFNSNDLDSYLILGLCYSERAKSDRSLSDARKSKDIMEFIIQKDYRFNYGIPLTVLGKLYFEVPGWPISFGKNKKSLQFLRDAIAINPKNRYNYLFLTEVLWDEGYKNEAQDIFLKGLNLPANPEFFAEDQKCLRKMNEKKKKYLNQD